jgi:hypothetical protein
MSGAFQSSAGVAAGGIETSSFTMVVENKSWLTITVRIINPNKSGNHDDLISFISE